MWQRRPGRKKKMLPTEGDGYNHEMAQKVIKIQTENINEISEVDTVNGFRERVFRGELGLMGL